MKKLFLLLTILVLAVTCFSACNLFSTPDDGNPPNNSDIPGGDAPGDELPDNNKPSGGGNNDDTNDPEEGVDGEVSKDAFTGNDTKTELCALSSATAKVTAKTADGATTLSLTDEKNNTPITVRVPVDEIYDTVKVVQGNTVKYAKVYTKDGISLVDITIAPNAEYAVITAVLTKDDKKLESEYGMTLENGIKIIQTFFAICN